MVIIMCTMMVQHELVCTMFVQSCPCVYYVVQLRRCVYYTGPVVSIRVLCWSSHVHPCVVIQSCPYVSYCVDPVMSIC